MTDPRPDRVATLRSVAVTRDLDEMLALIEASIAEHRPAIAAGPIDDGRLVPHALPSTADDPERLFALAECTKASVAALQSGQRVSRLAGSDTDHEAAALVALRAQGELVGAVVVAGDELLTEEEQLGLAEIGDELGPRFENVMSFTRERHRSYEAGLTTEIAGGLSASYQVPKLLALVARNAALVTGFDRGSILLADGAGGLRAAASQFADGHTDLRLWGVFRTIDVPVPAFAKTMESGVAAPFERPEEAPSLVPERWVIPFELRSIIVLPLIDRDERLGVLILDKSTRSRITQVDLAAAMRVAHQSAVVIGLTQLIERERASHRRSHLILSTVVRASTQLNKTGVLSVIAEGIGEVLKDATTVAFQIERGRPVRLAVRGVGDGAVDLIDTLLDWENASRGEHPFSPGRSSPLVIDPDDPARPAVRALGLGRILVIPIQRASRELGWVVSFDRRSVPYRDEEVRVVGTLAAQAALSLHTATLLEGERAAVARLEELDRLKTGFVATVSHELRTPLTAILGFSEILHELIEDADLRSFVEDIRRESSVLESLIGNLLDTSRLEAGMLQLNLRPMDVRALAEQAADVVGRGFRDRELQLHVPTDIGAVVMDGVRMRQVLINLLENAAKYSPDGTQVDLMAEADENTLTLIVDDRGPGVPEEHRKAIFDRFHRLSSHGAKPGTGIGLYLVRALVDAHGGRISVTDRPAGVGARFVVEIPLVRPPD